MEEVEEEVEDDEVADDFSDCGGDDFSDCGGDDFSDCGGDD